MLLYSLADDQNSLGARLTFPVIFDEFPVLEAGEVLGVENRVRPGTRRRIAAGLTEVVPRYWV